MTFNQERILCIAIASYGSGQMESIARRGDATQPRTMRDSALTHILMSLCPDLLTLTPTVRVTQPPLEASSPSFRAKSAARADAAAQTERLASVDRNSSSQDAANGPANRRPLTRPSTVPSTSGSEKPRTVSGSPASPDKRSIAHSSSGCWGCRATRRSSAGVHRQIHADLTLSDRRGFVCQGGRPA
jgi:hypothetical protein